MVSDNNKLCFRYVDGIIVTLYNEYVSSRDIYIEVFSDERMHLEFDSK